METEADLKAKDAVRAAALLVEAIRRTPERPKEIVETAFGTANVVKDGGAVDLDFQDGPTVHIRFG